jgi:hypothetical protein
MLQLHRIWNTYRSLWKFFAAKNFVKDHYKNKNKNNNKNFISTTWTVQFVSLQYCKNCWIIKKIYKVEIAHRPSTQYVKGSTIFWMRHMEMLLRPCVFLDRHGGSEIWLASTSHFWYQVSVVWWSTTKPHNRGVAGSILMVGRCYTVSGHGRGSWIKSTCGEILTFSKYLCVSLFNNFTELFA